MIRRNARLHSLLLFGVVVLAVPATAQLSSPFGIDIHTPVGSNLTLVMDDVQAAGIAWVNLSIIWPYVESAPGVRDWSATDAAVAAAQARHIEIMATIQYTPLWATSAPDWTGVPETAPWQSFCQAAAQRYAGVIQYWQIWNEPNQKEFWDGTEQQYIQQLLIPGADAIHAGNPEAKVGGPALAHLVSADWYDWLKDVLSQAGAHLDFVTHHTYDTSGNAGVTAKLTASTPFGSLPALWGVVPPSVREVLQSVGWFGRPFFLTETGWQSSAAGEAQQASNYTGFLNDWFTNRPNQTWIDRVFFYEVQDPDGAPNTTWGILRVDGSPKPAYSAYQAFIKNQQTPPPPPPPPSADNAQLVTQNLPISMETGQSINVGLTFKNTGTSTWTAGSNYKLGADATTDPFAAARQLLAPSDAIKSGQQNTFVFPFTAPGTPGSYTTHWQMLREGVAYFGQELTQTITVTQAPPAAQRTLSLLAGQFAVEVSWHDPQSGNAGFGRAVPSSDQTGMYWFFSADNIELVVKALDGRAVNGMYWFFYGALSDVEYWITVTDLATGESKVYYNPPGNLCGEGDTSAFSPAALAPASSAGQLQSSRWGHAAESSAAPRLDLIDTGTSADATGTCVPGPQTLCLLDNRFAVSVAFHLTSGSSGTGTAASLSDQSGTFWFFSPDNVELVTKVLDGRALTGKFWFFYGALTDVAYTITLTDTVTGTVRHYRNTQGNLCGRGDTSAID